MPSKYNQGKVFNSATHFSASPMSGIEFSRMTANPIHITSFNAGDIIPIYCKEVLPHDTFDFSLDGVIRQTTLLTPTMGRMYIDYYAFYVPNRVVDENWKNVQGENSSGMWVAPSVSLAPLYPVGKQDAVQIPVGSVADYYGLATQQPIPANVLSSMNDLKFRGYLACYNEYFRDQNYTAPIPFSKLNLYQGFLEPVGSLISVDGRTSQAQFNPKRITGDADGSSPRGSIVQAVLGEGAYARGVTDGEIQVYNRLSAWSALDKPLKANKSHDYFTSVLPSPQKGQDVVFNLANTAPVRNAVGSENAPLFSLRWYGENGGAPTTFAIPIVGSGGNYTDEGTNNSIVDSTLKPLNLKLVTDLTQASSIDVNSLRQGFAIQQTYELLARGGSRYREFVKSFFGIEVDDPFSDIPKYLGHIRRDLDLYQTAQTSASSDTPQGNLAAFGYTNTNGHLFTETFLEHGFVHVFAVVRHNNIYPAFLDRSWFRLNQLDWYLPTLANISEQPVYTREINPFCSDPNAVWGYNEAWSEYRFEPDVVSGAMRTGLRDQSLAIWNYADDFNSELTVADEDFMRSNSAEVLDRTLATTSELAPQFKGEFRFRVTKQRPMPTYSVPGLDVL